MKHIVLGILLGLSLAGCSSMSESECKTANWAQVGQRDGERGYGSSRIDSHRKACTEFGINVNDALYMSGYNRGLKVYCEQAGTKDGREGKAKQAPSSCSSFTALYATGYKVGWREYCTAQGAAAGQKADKKMGAASCHGTREFNAGFQDGMKTYCTPENAQNLGATGAAHQGRLCPRSLRTAFLKAYSTGAETYCTKQNGFELAKAGQEHRPQACPKLMRRNFEMAYKKGLEYQNIDKKIKELDLKVVELNTKIQNPATSPDLRAYLSKELGSKETEKNNLQVKKIKIEGFLGL